MRWKEQSTDIMQNTVSGTYHVANALKPRSSTWIDDEEQHSITDIAKNTAKASAAVIGKTFSLRDAWYMTSSNIGW